MAVFLAPAAPAIGSAIGSAATAVWGAITSTAGLITLGGAATVATGVAVHNATSGDEAADEADTDTKPVADSCSTCEPPDPCKGLRQHLREHEKKLESYRNNPHAHDHKGILGHSPERDASIINGRIKHLEGEIKAAKKNLKECEKENGM